MDQMIKFHVPLLFAVLSMANAAIYSSWKYLHKSVPKLPYRKRWPNYGLCLTQLTLIGALLYFGHEYNTSESQENGYEFDSFRMYAEENGEKFKMVRKEISQIRFPNFFEITKEMPTDLFLLRVRNEALKTMSESKIVKDTVFKELVGMECDYVVRKLNLALESNHHLFASFNTSLNESLGNWTKVINNQADKIKSQTDKEKFRFERHVARTRRMTDDVILYWNTASVMLRSFMLSLTTFENELFVLVYTTPLLVCIFYCFWAAVCALLFSHIPLDAMWRKIMKWLFYISSTMAIVLAIYQIYLGNTTPSCQPVPNEFHKIQIPSYPMDDYMKNPKFFENCATTQQSMFDATREAILVTRSNLVADVGFKLRQKAVEIFSTIPALDEKMANRSMLIFPIVEKMEKAVKSCPMYDQQVKPFREIAAALKDFMYVRQASPTSKEMVADSLDFNVLRMDRLVNNPIDRFNDVVRSTNFRCDDYQKMFVSAAKVSCDVVNVESMENFRVAIFGCLSLAAMFYLIYWRRADDSQYWQDPRVRFAQKFMTPNMDDEHHKEWKTIDFKHPEGVTYHHFVNNKKRNRYVDIPLIDQTRVILENHKTDYIHASWISIPGTERKYIATQAPLKSTMIDFWHMLIQENIKIVVMLTGFIELDLSICDFYFPDEVGMSKKYGKIEVTCLSKKDSPPEAGLVLTVKRVFQLRDLRHPDAPPQFVTHLHFQNWFSEVVPKFLCRVLYFHRYMDFLVVDDTPIVVHCNSGTERTGVFIAVDYAHELVIQDRFVSMKSLAEELGKLRWGVLDSFIPYLFITASLTTRFIYENYLFEDDWFVAYGKYSATKNNRLGKQDKMRRKKGVQVHYWKTFEVPDYYKPRIRRRAVFRNASDMSSEDSNDE